MGLFQMGSNALLPNGLKAGLSILTSMTRPNVRSVSLRGFSIGRTANKSKLGFLDDKTKPNQLANPKEAFDLIRNSAAADVALMHELCAETRPTWTSLRGFTPDPRASFINEFKRLADTEGWNKNDRNRWRSILLASEFETHYGKDNKSLANWQELCRVCKIQKVPSSIKKCKTALREVLVNIVNLVDSRRTREEVIIFETKLEFIKYTWPDRTYPLNQAVKNSLMCALLRPVSSPRYQKQAQEEFKKRANKSSQSSV